MQRVDFFGEIPEPRFGHTITQISTTKVLLYGGATGSGKYSITNDTYILDLITKKWRKIDPQGSSPGERAAHSTVSIESLQVILYGGATGGGGLANEGLFFLDLSRGEDKSRWTNVSTRGSSPGKRYGHSLVFIRPYIIVFGGVVANDPTNDVFILSLENPPFLWQSLNISRDAPCARVYHSACVCNAGSAKGMMMVFGGRSPSQIALNDLWGLRKHRDGKWDWIKAPCKTDHEGASGRFQHSSLMLGSFMFIIGGRANTINETLKTDIYDIDNGNWYKVNGVCRFRQTNWLFENSLYVHGGLDPSSPNVPINETLKFDLLQLCQESEYLLKNLCTLENFMSPPLENNLIKYGPGCNFYNTAINPSIKSPLGKKGNNQFGSLGVILSKKAYVASSYHPSSPDEKIRKISIIKLQEESKKIGNNTNSISSIKTFPTKAACNEEVADFFLEQLLVPSESISMDTKFNFEKNYLEQLCNEVEIIIQREPSLLRLRSPLKIFGNIHGQLVDLLQLFETFGVPTDILFPKGDIEGFTYLFLGDLIDEGPQSLETLILLFSLKIKHPDSIFFLRGHHEDIILNKIYGFGEECAIKLEENIDEPHSFFNKFNMIFQYFPLAALVNNEILCLHSGIGQILRKIEDIDRMERPIEISHQPIIFYEKIVWDILYSGLITKENGKNNSVLKLPYKIAPVNINFSTDRLLQFLEENKLKMIIRSHECVPQGFETAVENSFLTVFSALEYHEHNAACILVIKKNREIIKKRLAEKENSINKNKWQKNLTEKFPFVINELQKEMLMKKDEILHKNSGSKFNL